MYYKGEALRYSLREILLARARVTMRRMIRKTLGISTNGMLYRDLEILFNHLNRGELK